MDAQIRAATADDRDRVGRVMVDAFLFTPDAEWIEPDEGARRNLYRLLAGPMFDFAHHHGQIDVITTRGQVLGAAIWWPHPKVDTEASYVVALSGLLERISPRAGKRLVQLSAAIGMYYLKGHDHQYLAYIGVLRHRQSQGYGSALLAHRLHQLDAAGHAAYLVASSLGSRYLFGRHGFHVCHGSPFQLPDDGPPLWAMLREPQGQRP